MLTYENLLRLSDYQFTQAPHLKKIKYFNFLSFQDAMHYLIKAYHLQNKTILLPAFYCDATINDMKKHGLKIKLCKIDYKKFDIDYEDFITILIKEKPDVILIYDFFGKQSLLYDDVSWMQYVKKDVMLVSDLAHSLLPNKKIHFLNDKHFYIDSTRKITSQMMAHLVTPSHVNINSHYIIRFSLFKLWIRTLFFLKSWCLKIATSLNLQFFSTIGYKLYMLHDHYIGSSQYAYTGFWWDDFLYKHIHFDKIKKHRLLLFSFYKKYFQFFYEQGWIEIFDIQNKDIENIAFFFLRLCDEKNTEKFIQFLQSKAYWAEVLWDFDAILEINEADKKWAKSIIVLPYTLHTKEHHIVEMAKLTYDFFMKNK